MPDAERLIDAFRATRARSDALARPLTEGDRTAQSMPDASPAKWHLGHTTWFFERLVLGAHADGYAPFDPRFHYLFNSYYEALGPRQPRPQRGLLTRPTGDEVAAYRRHVEGAVERLFAHDGNADTAAAPLVELGINHEQQHQELLLTDILHLFAQNPLKPAYRAAPPSGPAPGNGAAPSAPPAAPEFVAFPGGIHAVGHAGPGFAFDCEGPRHEVLLRPFRLARHPVTNRQWLAFMAAGGYADPAHWLSDGWARAQAEGWQAPLYWERDADGWRTMTLEGMQPVEPDAPVCHVSYFEADAYARWAGHRLPTEFEWEVAAASAGAAGNTAGTGALAPRPDPRPAARGLRQMIGDVWEWTASPYMAYPGFRPAAGAVGEYNGKFMSGQFVLRGGSCVTPEDHLRPSYRNFFYPHQRWQFSGLRLAEDGG